MKGVAIETPRLMIREFQLQDKDAVQLYASDPAVVEFMKWGPNNNEETVTFLQKAVKTQNANPRYYYDLAVIQKNLQQLIGGCSLHINKFNDIEGELGYCYNKDFWRQGYASEAAEAMINFGFKHLKLHRIFATCDSENTGSAKVMEKIGMTKEGFLREHKFQKEKWRSSLIYSILEQEYDYKRSK